MLTPCDRSVMTGYRFSLKLEFVLKMKLDTMIQIQTATEIFY